MLQLLQHFAACVVGKQFAAFERLLDGPLQVFEVCSIPLRELHVGVVKAAFEEEIGQRLHQILRVDAEIVAGIFREP